MHLQMYLADWVHPSHCILYHWQLSVVRPTLDLFLWKRC